MDVYGVIRKKERQFAMEHGPSSSMNFPIKHEDFSCRTTVQLREGMVLLSSRYPYKNSHYITITFICIWDLCYAPEIKHGNGIFPMCRWFSQL